MLHTTSVDSIGKNSRDGVGVSLTRVVEGKACRTCPGWNLRVVEVQDGFGVLFLGLFFRIWFFC